MKAPTQHDKIVALCSDGDWHCQKEFRELFIWSPHKRRDDLKKRGYEFEERRCTHGIRLSKDFRLSSLPKPPEKRERKIEFLPDGSVREIFAN